MDDKKTIIVKNRSIFGCSDMKKSLSELALEELFASHQDDTNINHNKPDIFAASHCLPIDNSHDHMHFPFKNSEQDKDAVEFQEIMKEFSSPGDDPFYLYPNDTKVSPAMNFQSWMSGVGGISGSSQDESDEEEMEMEGASNSCGQTANNPLVVDDIKRIKRMNSNRESAQRSRRRKQAYLADLEQQVKELRGEHSSLFKHLSHASLQFKDAATNFRLLKAHVQALQAKVKLAEDLVARGSFTSSLTHLLHNYLNTPEDDHHYISNGLENADQTTFNTDLSSMPHMWPTNWDSPLFK